MHRAGPNPGATPRVAGCLHHVGRYLHHRAAGVSAALTALPHNGKPVGHRMRRGRQDTVGSSGLDTS
ncbi:hypothetical protein LY15_003827 [Prauserella flava]|uniref:Uncharacterized protein n=1 Tax=Prauserella sediminis TaxID=577680 RepID=A0A839XKD3_9PSEU|nr:hypothetical protein [Prauserella sediminis]MCR3721833.1 hypothetical protein [Prauserella flava]MCR3734524.1 hypothetical protein [Prauserella salsuginis]